MPTKSVFCIWLLCTTSAWLSFHYTFNALNMIHLGMLVVATERRSYSDAFSWSMHVSHKMSHAESHGVARHPLVASHRIGVNVHGADMALYGLLSTVTFR
jgi:hypothetical protein